MFDFLKRGKIRAYCQECGKDLTDLGGFALDLKIYCDGDCAVNDSNSGYPEILQLYRRGSKEIQKDIHRNKLVHFSKLEEKIHYKNGLPLYR